MNADRGTLERIRQVLRAKAPSVSPDTQEAAEEFASLCKRVNLRLQTAAGFLASGLRTEAKHEVETDPQLLDMARMLQAEDLVTWAEVSQSLGLPPAPPISQEIVEMLSFALEEGMPGARELDNLLKLYRRAAHVGTRRDRIQLLRRIRQVDLSNSNWTQDLRALETFRHRELFIEIERALQAEDPGQLDLLRSELLSKDWMLVPPKSMLDEFEAKYRAIRAKGISVRAAELAGKLSAAHCAQDFKTLDDLLVLWFELVKDPDFTPNPELSIRVDEADAWHRAEEERRAREVKFEKVVEKLKSLGTRSVVTPEDLESVLGEAERIGLPVPPEVLEPASSRLKSLRAARVRRARLKKVAVAGASLVVVALLAASGWLTVEYFSQRHDLAAIEDRLRREEWSQAVELLARLDLEKPRFSRGSEVGALRNRVSQAVEKDRHRQEDLKSVLESLAALGEKGFVPLEETEKLLRRGDQLAKSPGDLGALATFRTGLDQARLTEHQRLESDLEALVGSVKTEIDTLKKTDAGRDPERFRKSLERAETDFEAAEQLLPGSKVPASSMEELKARLVAARHRLEESELQATADSKALAEVYATLPDINAYQAAVERAADRTGLDAATSIRLNKLKASCGAYRAIVASSDWVISDSAEGRAAGVNALKLCDTTCLPWKSTLEKLRDDFIWFEIVEEFRKSLADLKEVPLFGGLRCVVARDPRTTLERTYYFADIPTPAGGGSELHRFKGMMYDAQFALVEQTFSVTTNTLTPMLAPHAAFLQKTATSAKNEPVSTFATFLIERLTELSHDKSINPVVALTFAEKLLTPLARLKDRELKPLNDLAGELTKFNNETNNDVYWLSETDEVQKSKNDARSKLDRIPDFSGALARVKFRRALTISSVNRKLRCVGQVRLSAEGGPFVVQKDGADELWIIEEGDRGRTATAVLVGSRGVGSYDEVEGIRARLVEGQPLFAPGDGQTTSKLLAGMVQTAHLSWPEAESWTDWPPLWPVNVKSVRGK